MEKQLKEIIKKISELELDDKVEAINRIKLELHKISPFSQEPVDFVQWVKFDKVEAIILVQKFKCTDAFVFDIDTGFYTSGGSCFAHFLWYSRCWCFFQYFLVATLQ